MHLSPRQLFLSHVAQTSPAPILLEIAKAEGHYLYDQQGNKYLDLIGGISVASLGHGNKAVIEAIKAQAEKHLHVMVYGEVEQNPQTNYATALAKDLPETLSTVFFTNSGSEATEGAMKLAKRYTKRNKFIAHTNAYHGSTQGALSLMSDEYFTEKYRPLLPNVHFVNQNTEEAINAIDETCAAFVLETVQAEKGCIPCEPWYLEAVSKKCKETGTLLIIDENQTGLGRTGTLWSFEQFGIVPDILIAGKALGGGLPLGAFIASAQIMQVLSNYPVLGHISTFGGHPLSCAAGLASYLQIKEGLDSFEVMKKNQICKEIINNQNLSITGLGLLLAVHFETAELGQQKIKRLLENDRIFTDWFLFAPNALRIAPALNIPTELLTEALQKITKN